MNVNPNLFTPFPQTIAKLVSEFERGRLEVGFGMSTVAFYMALVKHTTPEKAIALVNKGRAYFDLPETTIESIEEAKVYLRKLEEANHGEKGVI